jgi:hypothetical protein
VNPGRLRAFAQKQPGTASHARQPRINEPHEGKKRNSMKNFDPVGLFPVRGKQPAKSAGASLSAVLARWDECN